MARRQLRRLFDGVADTFGHEQFTTAMLKERVLKQVPDLDIESWMMTKWVNQRFENNTLEVVGSGAGRSLIYRVPSLVNGNDLATDRPGKPINDALGREALRRLLPTWFPPPMTFLCGDVVCKAIAQWPREPVRRVTFTVQQWIAAEALVNRLVITTPHKKSQRSYRLPMPPQPAMVPELAAQAVPTPAPKKNLEDFIGAAPSFAGDDVALRNTAVDQAVSGLCGLVDEVLTRATRVMREAAADLMRDFTHKLYEARITRLHELAESLPEYPKLYSLVQEMQHAEQVQPPSNGGVLPKELAAHTLSYHKGFETAVHGLPKHEQDLIKKAITFLVCNGDHYPSLKTARIDREIPNAPVGCFKSRAGDLRFTWQRKGKSFEFYTVFRRGDAPAVYGSE